jgi:hypothetical protein
VAKSMSRRRIVTMGAAAMAGAALPLVPGTSTPLSRTALFWLSEPDALQVNAALTRHLR